MNILVINAGSSSVKFTLFDVSEKKELAGGMVERIGLDGTVIVYKDGDGNKKETVVAVDDASGAVAEIITALTSEESGVIKDKSGIDAVGHRVVHGGEKISHPVIIDAGIKKIISDCCELAPLHNPPNLAGIEACESILPNVKQVAVFDTAFHASIPDRAFLYGLPYEFYTEKKIRKYGFHGTSHKFVAQEAARFLNKDLSDLKLITCHLGNGCSITAVDCGESVDTSMGFTPLEGIIMGTRCGDIDPAVILYLMDHDDMDSARVNKLLNKESGLLGMAGVNSSDMRDVLSAVKDGKKQAEQTLSVYGYRIKKYIGAYMAAMNGVDAVIFTGGIGENVGMIRKLACGDLDNIGIKLDDKKNESLRGLNTISSDDSKTAILIVPTNEELMIASSTAKLV